MIRFIIAIVVAALLLPTMIQAENSRSLSRTVDGRPRDSIFAHSLLLGAVREIARLGHGGCIRGPFWIKDDQGDVIFRLEKGVEYPTGCGDMR